MRNEKQVIDELLGFAKNNDKVRAVILNGSRVNPNAPKDIFRDYDVVFAVTDPEHFLKDQSWIRNLGELIVMQQNDCFEGGAKWYIFLMLFKDGIRIDLSFFPVEHIEMQYRDSLKLLLLDKDNIIDTFSEPNDSCYVPAKPGQKEYDKTVNEFWWCSTNIAKGIWRDELTYTKYMFDVVVRDAMLKLVFWYIGVNYDWKVNPGKCGKWFKNYLPAELWQSLVKAYAGYDYEDIWDSLFEACRLTRIMGMKVADSLGFVYPVKDDVKVTEYLDKVRHLSKAAKSIDG